MPVWNDKYYLVQLSRGLSWYGNWCGGGHGGLDDCCDGEQCRACARDRNAARGACVDMDKCWPARASAACLSECPPVDDLDVLCLAHDLCVSLQPTDTIGCTYRPLGFAPAASANACACDKALYEQFVQRFGNSSEGYLRNQRSWLTSTWGRCFTHAADGTQQCVPYLGTVSPAQSSKPASDGLTAAATQLAESISELTSRAMTQLYAASAPAPSATAAREAAAPPRAFDAEEAAQPSNRTLKWVAVDISMSYDWLRNISRLDVCRDVCQDVGMCGFVQAQQLYKSGELAGA